MTDANQALVTWYLSQPGRSVSRDLATGYLLTGKASPKLTREIEPTLAAMRADHARATKGLGK